MSAVSKLWDNLGNRAVRTLGFSVAGKLWLAGLQNLNEILRHGNLVPIDRRLSQHPKIQIQHRFGRFYVNPAQIDNLIREESYCFGSIREIYVRDCYFRHHQDLSPSTLNTVVDLGANRGMFATLCTAFAKKIITVEPQETYHQAITYNMQMNGFQDYKIVHAFVGPQTNTTNGSVALEDLLAGYQIACVDFLKIDIEGAEFQLFQSFPYHLVRNLTMEVHREHGDPEILISLLQDNGFKVIATNSEFHPVTDLKQIDYIYASRK